LAGFGAVPGVPPIGGVGPLQQDMMYQEALKMDAMLKKCVRVHFVISVCLACRFLQEDIIHDPHDVCMLQL
jgi:hypothetical protein